MKIQCDVCGAAEASVFCSADEAALCHPCDHRVHRANKLAGKHRRFSLLDPTSSSTSHPLCDVCQEKRGLVFCREDRAILCIGCDSSIHTTNTLTMKHSRFLLTGVGLSTDPAPSSSATHEAEAEVTTNSISEYLIKMLPGWHVEDLLTDDSASTITGDDSCQVGELVPFLETEELPIWAFPASPVDHPVPAATGDSHHGVCSSNEANLRRRWSDDAFAVPQIHSECVCKKSYRASP